MKRRNIIFLIFLIFSLVTPFLSFSQYHYGLTLPNNRKSIIVPFELYNNLIIVKIKYNNFLTLNFILDTGVRSAILTDSKMALLIQAKTVRPIKIGGLGGTQELNALIATGLSYSIAGLDGKDQLLIILTDDIFSLSKFIGKEVHGILGYEIFNRFVVEINYKNRFLKLHEPSSYRYKGNGELIPLEVEDTKPFIPAKLKIKGDSTIPVKLIVDTGAGHALALYKGTHPQIVFPEKVIPSLLGRGLSGDIHGYIGRVKSLKLGDYVIDNIISSFPDSTELAESVTSHNRNGNLGADILSRYKVIFNYAGGYMILEKQRRRHRPFYFNMSGIDIICTGEDLQTYIIDYVRPNSPADKAEIQTGDVIVEINDRTDMNLSDINTLFQSRPGRKIFLRIKRGEQYLKKSVVLKELI